MVDKLPTRSLLLVLLGPCCKPPLVLSGTCTLCPQENEVWAAEVRIAKSRCQAIDCVLGSDAKLLEEYLAKFQGIGDVASSMGKRNFEDIGNAPPCGLYKELTTLASVKESLEKEIVQSTTADQLASLRTTQAEALAPAKSLVTACKSAAAELGKAIALQQKGKLGPQTKKMKKEQEVSEVTPKKVAAKATIFELSAKHGKVLSSSPLTCAAGGESPALVVNKAAWDAHLKADGALRQSITTWRETKWQGSMFRLQQGRAADSIADCGLWAGLACHMRFR